MNYMTRLRTIFFFAALFLPVQLHAESKVGVILTMTGDFARYGEKIRVGLESKKASDVRYVYEDEGCDPKKAVTAYQKLSAIDGIRVFIGPWCGSPQVAVASLLRRSDGFAILGSSAPERVFELSGGRMLSVQPSIEAESRFNAKEAYRLGARKVVIVFFENDFSRAHEAAFRQTFQGEVLDTLVYSTPDASALRGLATKIKRMNPDTVYIPDAFPLMQGLTKQLSTVGVKGVRLMSVYSAQSDDVLEAVRSTGDGLILSYPKIEGEALHYYPQLAAEVLMYGVGKCPELSSECIQRAVRSKYTFDEHGVMQGELELKVIKEGNFVRLER
jgi:ABC-type branched-subunit amino acid transport system substrate-binding protein